MPEEYPGSERHFKPYGRNLDEARMSKEERVAAIRKAAVDFANDYGPLSAANSGDEEAAHEVATRMYNALRRNGLTIIPH